jgi:hypothetical protein
MKKRVEYNLPEWAFLDAQCHEGDPLNDRDVIMHIRSASVIEIICMDLTAFTPREGALVYKFKYVSKLGVPEHYLAVLHYCKTLDEKADREMIKEAILKPCAKWYCDYLLWEDDNLL